MISYFIWFKFRWEKSFLHLLWDVRCERVRDVAAAGALPGYPTVSRAGRRSSATTVAAADKTLC